MSIQNYENRGATEAYAPFLGPKIPQNGNIFKERYQQRNKHPLTSYKIVSGMCLVALIVFLRKNMDLIALSYPLLATNYLLITTKVYSLYLMVLYPPNRTNGSDFEVCLKS